VFAGTYFVARPLPTAMVFLASEISSCVKLFVAIANTSEITTGESKIDPSVDFLRDLTMIGDT
jgi:hypothetical protein